MNKNLKKSVNWSIERKALIALSFIFVAVILSAWVYAMKLRQTVAANNAVINVDAGALVEVERLRNIAESQIATSRSFFLLGSRALFDQQKKDKQTLAESLAGFEKKYDLPQIPEIVKRIGLIGQQHQEIFDQAMEFREKQTESKIVGQFYQSKTTPIRKQINEALDEIVRVHNAELDRARTFAKDAAYEAQVQIPRGMAWFTGLMGFIFVCLSFLVVLMLRQRMRHLAERNRLYDEAKNAVLARDEVIFAISRDLKEPLDTINEIADSLTSSTDTTLAADRAELIKSSILGIEDLIKDIGDQKKADMGTLTLRLDQLGIDEILNDARIILQPLAKHRDIRLQFDSVNPPVLAFFDRERVVRVLANLVGNAIKFSPKHSKVIVKVRSDQQFVNISVADSGPGISEKQLPGIFDHFWQARKTADQGPGVGLAIVKTIVEAHGGTVRVDSHVGYGSTFTFSLPRRRPVGANLKRPTTIVKQATRLPQAEIYEGLNS
ncbi:MAG: HAMP domain-containing sensor histidine kinase [Bdellovibrionota bacterium]